MAAVRKPSRKVLRSLCAQPHADDGVDPREWVKVKAERSGRKAARKARQLCSQVAEALDQVLAGDCSDDLLRDLQVVAVEPAPDASRLLVTVRMPASAPVESLAAPGLILDRLARASGRLRCAVAAAITRKRTPTLGFRLAIPVGDGGGPAVDKPLSP